MYRLFIRGFFFTGALLVGLPMATTVSAQPALTVTSEAGFDGHWGLGFRTGSPTEAGPNLAGELRVMYSVLDSGHLDPETASADPAISGYLGLLLGTAAVIPNGEAGFAPVLGLGLRSSFTLEDGASRHTVVIRPAFEGWYGHFVWSFGISVDVVYAVSARLGQSGSASPAAALSLGYRF